MEDTGLDFQLLTVLDACLAYLKYAYENSGITGARKVYSAVLFQSSVKVSEDTADGVTEFLECCLKLEKCESKMDKKRLTRLNELGMKLFAGTAMEDEYREQRNSTAVFS